MTRRFSRLRAVLALAVIAGGLTVIGSQSATGAGQNGINNYAGPRSCSPLDAGNAHATYGVTFDVCGPATGIDAQTSFTQAGLNVYEASGSGGTVTYTVTQTNTSGANVFVCDLVADVANARTIVTNQECNATQNNASGNNTISARVHAKHSFSENLLTQGFGTLASQDATIRLTGVQKTTTGDNVVKGVDSATARLSIDQDIVSELSLDVPARQQQDSLVIANLSQFACTLEDCTGDSIITGDNSIKLDLERDQTVDASAASPQQRQDVTAAGHNPNGLANIVQRSETGNQEYIARAHDKKDENARVLDGGALGGPTQIQGHPGGGWAMRTDVESLGNPGGTTVDLGTPPNGEDPNCTTAGIIKDWDITAKPTLGEGNYNGAVQERRQDDDITIPIIGKSPSTTTSYECSSLNAPFGTSQVANVNANGHAKSAWTGALAATTNADTGRVDFSAQSVDEALTCDPSCASTSGSITGSGTNFSVTEGAPFEGEVASFTDASPVGPYTASINWGDGNTSDGTVVSNQDGSYSVRGAHTYDTAQTYDVEITVFENGVEGAFMRAKAIVSEAAIELTARDDLVANQTAYSGQVATFSDANSKSQAGEFTATIAWGDGQTSNGTITGGNGSFSIAGTHTYADSHPLGPQTTTVTLYEVGNPEPVDSDTGQIITFKYLSSGSFAIGNLSAANSPADVTWWSPNWSSANQLSGGPAPSGFKGFANQLTSTPPKCTDGNWKSTTGNSPPPSSAVPSYMGLIVTSKVTGGSKPSGDIVKVVVVQTNPGYQPNAGSSGTGSIVATICSD